MSDLKKRHSLRLVRLGALLASCFLLAVSAGATTVYLDQFGTNYSFKGIQETSNSGDPEPLFGAPLLVGDALVFTPLTFSATTTDALCVDGSLVNGCEEFGGFATDNTWAQLQILEIMSTSALPIDIINIQEFGDVTLTGTAGFAGAGVVMQGLVTVLEQGGVPCTGCLVPFSLADNNVTITNGGSFADPSDTGTFLGTATIDVAALYPNATKVVLSFDNDLSASSAVGGGALIEKKPTIIISVPEPAMLMLLGGGLGLALRARSRRD